MRAKNLTTMVMARKTRFSRALMTKVHNGYYLKFVSSETLNFNSKLDDFSNRVVIIDINVTYVIIKLKKLVSNCK